MRFHCPALPLVPATLALSIVLLTACGKKQEEAPSLSSPPTGPPVVIITQTPEYPRPGQYVQYPRGLVAAMWSDGRIVRCADPSMVGKSYVSGVVREKDRDEFLEFLKSSEVTGAPKVPHLRLHAATMVTTIRTGETKEKWVLELPDDESIWVKVRARLLNLPLSEGHAADESTVQDASKDE